MSDHKFTIKRTTSESFENNYNVFSVEIQTNISISKSLLKDVSRSVVDMILSSTSSDNFKLLIAFNGYNSNMLPKSFCVSGIYHNELENSPFYLVYYLRKFNLHYSLQLIISYLHY